jgi:ABC-type polar amino acid transport system ATPase subunit
MITVNNLSVQIKEQLLLDTISCTLLPGRITTFMGKSGAGKTTLLKSLVGLVEITDSTILLNGKQIKQLTPAQRAKEIGYVFQDFNLFQNLTVVENCMNPLLVRGIDKDTAEQQAYDILQKLGMQNFINKYPAQLSGGQQQRVTIARALCLQPQALLLDEPTASLDPLNTDNLVTIVQKLASTGLTIGIATQDMQFMNKIFDRTYYIENGKIMEFCDKKENIDTCPNIKIFMNI